MIITNQSLVLQKVSRTESGLYQCHAINQEGQGSSNTVNLPIKCKYCIVFSIDFFSDGNFCIKPTEIYWNLNSFYPNSFSRNCKFENCGSKLTANFSRISQLWGFN